MKNAKIFNLLIVILFCSFIISCSDNDKNEPDPGTPVTVTTLHAIEWTQNQRTDSLVYLYEDASEFVSSKYYAGKDLISWENFNYQSEDFIVSIEKTVGTVISLDTYKSYDGKLLMTSTTGNNVVTDTLYLNFRNSKTKSSPIVKPILDGIHYENGDIDLFEYDVKGNLSKITKDDVVITYTYDDRAGYGLLSSKVLLWVYYCSDIPFNGYTNRVNNKLSETRTYKNGEVETYTYRYTYNTDNLPVTMTTHYTKKDVNNQVTKEGVTDYKFIYRQRTVIY
jgi:hypothetical protein